MIRLFLSIMFFTTHLYAVISKSPEHHKEKIQHALQEAFQVDWPDKIEPIKGGFSSPGIYKITIKGKPYLFRIIGDFHSAAERKQEIKAATLASKLGISPKLIYAHEQKKVMITEFFDGSHLNRSQILQEKTLSQLLTKIRSFHESKEIFEPQDIYALIYKCANAFKQEKPPLVTKALERLEVIYKKLKPLLEEKPTHFDLYTNNILLKNNQISIIDWEFMGAGDPYFDIATLSIFYAFDKEQDERLLKTYLQHPPSAQEREKFYLMRELVAIYYGIAFLAIIPHHGLDLLSEKDIDKLPQPPYYFREKDGHLLKSLEDARELAYVLLKDFG